MQLNQVSTLVELLGKQAQQQPNQVAYRWLKDGELEAGQLTYGKLYQRAQAIAATLQTIASSGDRALLVYSYEVGLSFVEAFLGCLFAGVVAVPCHPPRNRSALEDLQARLLDCDAAVILTEKTLFPKLKSQLLDAQGIKAHLLNTEEISIQHSTSWIEPTLHKDTLAFLQYTSGSTGQPKGVMVTHGCILQNEQMLQLSFGNNASSVIAGWLPLFHDMGLIGNVLQPLYLGATCVLMSPIAFVQKPVRWLQAISSYQATVSGGPNFAYDLLCHHVTEEQKAKLDLSSWRVAFSGAEAVRAETLERFATAFAACGFQPQAFYPCYGMAEATLFITGGLQTELPVVRYAEEHALRENRVVLAERPQEGFRALVGCGQAWLDGQVAIAHPDQLTRSAVGEVGEIWVAGGGVAKGYWNRPEETAQTFEAYLQDTHEGPFLRTGDLGFLHDGELFITGRLKEILVLWGFNHYPQHIEQTVQRCHSALRLNGGAAFAVELNGEDRLVLAQEVERTHRNTLVVEDVVEAIRWAVFDEHFVEVAAIALLKPGSLPRTSSGKIRRRACREMFLNDQLETLAVWRSPTSARGDMTQVLQRYLNPLTHVRRGWMSLCGWLKRWIFLMFDKS